MNHRSSYQIGGPRRGQRCRGYGNRTGRRPNGRASVAIFGAFGLCSSNKRATSTFALPIRVCNKKALASARACLDLVQANGGREDLNPRPLGPEGESFVFKEAVFQAKLQCLPEFGTFQVFQTVQRVRRITRFFARFSSRFVPNRAPGF